MRVAILKKKAEAESVKLGDEVAFYLAKRAGPEKSDADISNSIAQPKALLRHLK